MLQLAISIRVSESIFQRAIRHKNTARFLAPWADRNVFQQLLAFEKPRVAVTSVNLAVDSPCHQAVTKCSQMAMDQYLLIPFLRG